MDRLSRIVTHGGLAVLFGSTVASLGCRSMKSEIPPGKAYSTTGTPTASATPDVGFSSAPRPDATGAAGLYNGIQQASGNSTPPGASGGVQQAAGIAAPGIQPQYGTPIGNKNSYNEVMPAAGKYGPPGSSALSAPSLPAQTAPANDTPAPAAEENKAPLQGAIGVDLP